MDGDGLTIGSRIKGLRVATGLSKSELARMAGVTPTAVWNWEENGIVPRSGAFAMAAIALGVSEAFLRTGTGNTAATPSAPRTVAMIIEAARSEIAAVTGIPLNNVRLSMEFVSN